VTIPAKATSVLMPILDQVCRKFGETSEAARLLEFSSESSAPSRKWRHWMRRERFVGLTGGSELRSGLRACRRSDVLPACINEFHT
jgi:hypothetical protein